MSPLLLVKFRIFVFYEIYLGANRNKALSYRQEQFYFSYTYPLYIALRSMYVSMCVCLKPIVGEPEGKVHPPSSRFGVNKTFTQSSNTYMRSKSRLYLAVRTLSLKVYASTQ